MRRLFMSLAILGLSASLPAAAMAGDQETAQQIASSLKSSGRLQGYRINVKVHEGTAWLIGDVRSDEQMAAALEVAGSAPGIEKVVNNMTVKSATASLAPSNSSRPGRAGVSQPMPPAMAAIPQRAVQTSFPSTVDSAEHAMTESVFPTPRQVAMPSSAMTASTARTQTRGRAPLPIGAMPMPPRHVQHAPQRVAMQTQATMPEGGMHGGSLPAGVDGGTMGAPVGGPIPSYIPPVNAAVAPARYDHPHMPNYAWPSYAAYPNYGAVTYPKQYSPTAWPFIGPFYPYPQVPLGWRKVTLEWDDGWWMLDFKD